MNDPWDVKSVRQSNQYLSCMKINGVPLLPPVLSKECYVEMQYYKLLAKEVEKRIQTLKPLIVDSDSEFSEDRTDAPELPESEQSYDVTPEEIQVENKDYVTHLKTEKCLEDCYTEKIQHISNTYDNITSNFSIDTDSASSKLSSKFVIDLSLSINETGRHLADSTNTSNTVDIPERDYDYPKRNQKEVLMDIDKDCKTKKKADQLSCNINNNKDLSMDPLSLGQDGPSSLTCKSFTGSLHNIHLESVKQAPLIRQRSYTVLIPSPMLLAHLEVQSINTGMDITSISMSESMSNISSNKKRRSWDLETAKVKWSSMALELKEKNISNNNKTVHPKSFSTKPTTKKAPQVIMQRSKSLAHDKVKNIPPKVNNKSEPVQRSRKGMSPVRNSTPQSKSAVGQKSAQKKTEEVETSKQDNVSESEDPASRVRELYDKIQKQQLIQMANLVEKQKKEQMLLQKVFEEQNSLLFTQLKTIRPKSPNDIKEACKDQNNEIGSRGPVSLSQLINQKQPEHPAHNSPVLSTLTETNNYINYCDDVLKKSRVITGSMKKTDTKLVYDKSQSPQQLEGSKTRSYSPSRRNTPTSRKLTYENSVSSDRENDQILTDRTNDTMADILNVTFPSDYSDECPPYLHKSPLANNCTSASESPVSAPTMAASYRSANRPIRSLEQNKQLSINSICRTVKPSLTRTPTAQERAAATKIVSLAKGYLVRRLMNTERVQATVQTIKDALLCALQLHQEREGIRGADVDLHRRLIQQITAACYSLHDTFIASSPGERCALVAADRSRRQLIAARLPTPTRHKATDVMSQSHSGAFPPRVKRQPPSLMTQSNYETFSSDKSVRRYMPSPRRRPWR